MCISLAPVQFGKTVTGMHEAEDGSHVVFYQNVVGAPTAKSASSTTRGRRRRSASAAKGAALPGNWQVASKARGNALVIPLVTGDFGSVELLRGTAETPDLLRDIRRTLLPPQRRSRGSRSFGSDSKGAVVIEQFDIYTIVRAEKCQRHSECGQGGGSAQASASQPGAFRRPGELVRLPLCGGLLQHRR